MKFRRLGGMKCCGRRAAEPGRQLRGLICQPPEEFKIFGIVPAKCGNEIARRPSESPERRASLRWEVQTTLSKAILHHN
jgi:hypothetical protein